MILHLYDALAPTQPIFPLLDSAVEMHHLLDQLQATSHRLEEETSLRPTSLLLVTLAPTPMICLPLVADVKWTHPRLDTE